MTHLAPVNRPTGEIPKLDVETIGFSKTWRFTEQTEQTEQSQAIASVCSVTESDAIECAIVSTLPNGPGRRNRQVLELARALKAEYYPHLFSKASAPRSMSCSFS